MRISPIFFLPLALVYPCSARYAEEVGIFCWWVQGCFAGTERGDNISPGAMACRLWMYASLATLIKPICLSFYMSLPLHNYRRKNIRDPSSLWSPSTIEIYNNVEVVSEDSADRGKTRRWRRRKREENSNNIVDDSNIPNNEKSNDSEAALVASKNADNATEIEFSTDYIMNVQQKKSSACPLSSYSMTFLRYRIDKTTLISSSFSSLKDESEKRRIRRIKQGIITKLVRPNNMNEQKNDKSPFSIFSDIIGDINSLTKDIDKTRKSVDTLYKKEIKNGHFRWVSSESLINIDVDFHAAAEFWKMASDIITRLATIEQQPIMENNNIHHQQRIWYLALPETTSSVAQSFCDILNWYSNYSFEQITKDGKQTTADAISIRSDLDSRDISKIPVVKFTVSFNSEVIRQQLQDRQKQRSLLPTAVDTERRTKAWVKRVLVQLGICPFTKSEYKSGQGLKDLGVPVANIMYCHSSALGLSGGSSDVYLLMADVWQAISDMIAARPTGVSSILLAAPGFDDNFTLWSGPVFAMLESCVGAIQGEEIIGVVCFHPKYKTPDGQSWPGFGHMHSVPRLVKWYNQYNNPEATPHQVLDDDEIAAGGAWQRRTPHAVINVLRAEQLEAAEGRRSTGELYGRNIRVLVGKEEGSVGLDKLSDDLAREQRL